MRLDCFTSRTSFTCNECGKLFELKGHWYNQIGLETYNDLRYCWHKLVNHRQCKKNWKYIFRLHLLLPIVVMLEILNMICIPFRYL